MPSPDGADGAPKQRRTRAKRACKNCNSRRVRCNVLETKPCYNCATAHIVCELLPSRRGKYQRKRSQNPSSYAPSSYATPPPFRPAGLSPANPGHQHPLDVSATTERASDIVDFQVVEDPISATPQIETPSTQATEPRAMERPGVEPQAVDTQVVDTQVVETQTTETQVTETQAIDRTLFFGESNFLTCVAGGRFGRPQPPSQSAQPTNRLCYPISDAINTKGSKTPAAKSIPISVLRYNFLQSENALTFPDPQDCLQVLRAYFRWFHPCFPVLDRTETARTVKTGEISPLLLQAILFIGASYCGEEAIHRMGFKDRPEAKAQHYQRARLLYDADWESNKVTVLQTLFLMSFWRAGPLNEKNTRYWLGSAISLAQTRGFHRAVHTSTVGMKQAKMRRRIWWSIYVRDRQSSASLGLPSRIRDEDCDIEMLSSSDLEEETDVSVSDMLGTSEPVHIMYALEMAKLAKLLGNIMTNQFTPGKSHLDQDERSRLLDALLRWRSELPEDLRECGSDSSRPGMIWTYLLHLAYNNLQILLHRRAYVRLQNKSDTRDGEVALQAACRITRIVEDMLSQDLLRFGQLHVITSLFSSLCMHTISLQRSKDTTRRLAENRAQMCLIGLKEVQKYWEVNNLVLELFFQYIDESTAKTLRPSEAEPASDAAAAATANSNASRSAGQASSISYTNMSPHAFGGPFYNNSQELPSPDGYPAFGEHDPLLSGTPQSTLYQSSTSDPFAFFMDSQARINDGLDMQGLQFLQRCL